MTQLEEFQDHLRRAKRIVVLVGAGLLASSGLPIKKGTQGLWKNFNMIDLATPDAFYIDPGLVWQYYSWRRRQALRAEPNAGHRALARLSEAKETLTIMQNDDGLLARAGHRRRLHEIHGSLFQLRCTSFTCTYVERNNTDDPLTPALEVDARDAEIDHTDPALSPQFAPVKELSTEELPACPACGTLMRPGVVWFGELLLLHELDAIDTFLEDGFVDLVLVVGTAGTVYPANGYVEMVRARGGAVAVFNTDIEAEILDGALEKTWGFRGDAAEWLPRALSPVIGDV